MTEIDKLPFPHFARADERELADNFKKIINGVVLDLHDAESGMGTLMKFIKFVVDSCDNIQKQIKELKKTEGKAYTKEVELLESKIVKSYESGKKSSSIDSEIEMLNRELKSMKKNKETYSKQKGMDTKSMKEKVIVLMKERNKLTEEFNRSKEEILKNLKMFNEKHTKQITTFNKQTETIDHKVRDNIEFFRKKFNEFLNNSKVFEPTRAEVKHRHDSNSSSPYLPEYKLHKSNPPASASQQQESGKISNIFSSNVMSQDSSDRDTTSPHPREKVASLVIPSRVMQFSGGRVSNPNQRTVRIKFII